MREIDAQVAERVFGRTVEEHLKFDVFPYGTTTSEYPVLVWSDQAVRGDSGYVAMPIEGFANTERFVPPFSTDIAAAWQVVEKLNARGLVVTVQQRLRRAECEIVGPQEHLMDTPLIWGAEADTAPMAICLAALKAVGEEPT